MLAVLLFCFGFAELAQLECADCVKPTTPTSYSNCECSVGGKTVKARQACYAKTVLGTGKDCGTECESCTAVCNQKPLPPPAGSGSGSSGGSSGSSTGTWIELEKCTLPWEPAGMWTNPNLGPMTVTRRGCHLEASFDGRGDGVTHRFDVEVQGLVSGIATNFPVSIERVRDGCRAIIKGYLWFGANGDPSKLMLTPRSSDGACGIPRSFTSDHDRIWTKR